MTAVFHRKGNSVCETRRKPVLVELQHGVSKNKRADVSLCFVALDERIEFCQQSFYISNNSCESRSSLLQAAALLFQRRVERNQTKERRW